MFDKKGMIYLSNPPAWEGGEGVNSSGKGSNLSAKVPQCSPPQTLACGALSMARVWSGTQQLSKKTDTVQIFQEYDSANFPIRTWTKGKQL